MFFIFLSVIVFLTSDAMHCSESHKASQQHFQESLLDIERACNALPLGQSGDMKISNLLEINKKLGLQALACWTKDDSNLEKGSYPEPFLFLSRFNGRIEILWNVFYKEKFGEDGIGEFYALVNQSIDEYPKECFITGEFSALNEEVLFKFLDTTVAKSVERLERFNVTRSTITAARELIKTELPTRRSVVDQVMTFIASRFIQNSNTVETTAQGQAAAALSSPLGASDNVDTKKDQLTWVNQKFSLFFKNVDSDFILKPIFHKLAITIEKLFSQNSIELSSHSQLQLCVAKKDTLEILYKSFESKIIEQWHAHHKDLMGSQHIKKYYEIVSHCLDEYEQDVLRIEINEKGVYTTFLHDAANHAHEKIDIHVKAYVEVQKKEKNEAEKLVQLAEIKKQKESVSHRFNSLVESEAVNLLSKHKKEIGSFFNASCGEVLTQQAAAYSEILTQQASAQKDSLLCSYHEDMTSAYQDLQKNITELMKKEDDRKSDLACLVAANAQSAEKFYAAALRTKNKKDEEQKKLDEKRKKLVAAQCEKEQKELISLLSLGRSALENHEKSKAEELQVAMNCDWRLAAQATMVSRLAAIQALQAREVDFARNNNDLVISNRNLFNLVQATENQRQLETARSAQLAQQLQSLQNYYATAYSSNFQYNYAGIAPAAVSSSFPATRTSIQNQRTVVSVSTNQAVQLQAPQQLQTPQRPLTNMSKAFMGIQ